MWIYYCELNFYLIIFRISQKLCMSHLRERPLIMAKEGWWGRTCPPQPSLQPSLCDSTSFRTTGLYERKNLQANPVSVVSYWNNILSAFFLGKQILKKAVGYLSKTCHLFTSFGNTITWCVIPCVVNTWQVSMNVQKTKTTTTINKQTTLKKLSVLMLCALSNRRRPFSYHTKMADFEYFRVLSVFSWNKLA